MHTLGTKTVKVWFLLGVSCLCWQATANVPSVLVDRFKLADADHDGYLSEDEHRRFIDIGFERGDLNGDGMIDREELTQSMVRNGGGRLPIDSPVIRKAVNAFFAITDRNRDGLLSKDEVLAMAPLGFTAKDDDGDGRLSLQDLVAHVPGLQLN